MKVRNGIRKRNAMNMAKNICYKGVVKRVGVKGTIIYGGYLYWYFWAIFKDTISCKKIEFYFPKFKCE